MCDTCGWQGFLNHIEEALDTGRCEKPRDTLEGIYETVQGKGCCTERQKVAVNNITRKFADMEWSEPVASSESAVRVHAVPHFKRGQVIRNKGSAKAYVVIREQPCVAVRDVVVTDRSEWEVVG